MLRNAGVIISSAFNIVDHSNSLGKLGSSVKYIYPHMRDLQLTFCPYFTIRSVTSAIILSPVRPCLFLEFVMGQPLQLLVSRVYKSCDNSHAERSLKSLRCRVLVKGEKFEPQAQHTQQPCRQRNNIPLSAHTLKRTNWRFNHISPEIMQPARSRF